MITAEEFCAFAMKEAARNGSFSFLQELLDRGENVNCKHDGDTPLHAACEQDDLDIYRLLIDNGADLEAKNDDKGDTPLLTAFDNYMWVNFEEVVRLFIRNGADINAANNHGRTAMHKTCKDRRKGLKMIKLLIENGAGLNPQDNDGKTPLHLACENGFFGVVQFLVSKGADLNMKTAQGYTPLHLACTKEQLEVVWFLVRQHPRLVSECL